MISVLPVVAILISLFLLEMFYFKIASHFNIIDRPNDRSSHSSITLRGGGVIFCVAVLIFYVLSGFQYPFFVLGLLVISIISFLDDVHTLNNKVRLTIHLIAVLLLFVQWNLYDLPWYWLIVAGIFIIGTINAYNFMDGINGVTGGYSLITILSLYYINNKIIDFTSNDLLIIVGLSLLVFNFFNFRNKAKCFAGDVGSVSVAFILIFLLGQLIIKTNNISYIFLLLLYGIDVITTVFFRLVRKENIFGAHRTHFYQHLTNKRKLSHVIVSLIYVAVQLFLNIVFLVFLESDIFNSLIFAFSMGVFFVALRFKVEGKKTLLGAT